MGSPMGGGGAAAHRRHAAHVHEPVRLGEPHRRLPGARARRRAAVGRALGRRLATAARRRLGRQRLAGLAAHERRPRRGHPGKGRPRRGAREDRSGPITIRRLTLEVDGRRRQGDERPGRPGLPRDVHEQRRPGHHRHAHRPTRRARLLHRLGRGVHAATTTTCTITMRGNRSVRATFVTDITAPTPAASWPPGSTVRSTCGSTSRSGRVERRERAAAPRGR